MMFPDLSRLSMRTLATETKRQRTGDADDAGDARLGDAAMRPSESRWFAINGNMASDGGDERVGFDRYQDGLFWAWPMAHDEMGALGDRLYDTLVNYGDFDKQNTGYWAPQFMMWKNAKFKQKINIDSPDRVAMLTIYSAFPNDDLPATQEALERDYFFNGPPDRAFELVEEAQERQAEHLPPVQSDEFYAIAMLFTGFISTQKHTADLGQPRDSVMQSLPAIAIGIGVAKRDGSDWQNAVARLLGDCPWYGVADRV